MSKIRNLRMGTPPHKTIEIGNGANYEGIKQINVIDWLLSGN